MLLVAFANISKLIQHGATVNFRRKTRSVSAFSVIRTVQISTCIGLACFMLVNNTFVQERIKEITISDKRYP